MCGQVTTSLKCTGPDVDHLSAVLTFDRTWSHCPLALSALVSDTVDEKLSQEVVIVAAVVFSLNILSELYKSSLLSRPHVPV